MSTDTVMLAADQAGCTRAAEILRAGGLVAFPTETVYGLGADACSDHAVARIFEAKERPQFNPLIAHVEGPEMAARLVRWTHTADALAGAFWPGPLTLVLPLAEGAGVSSLVTAGLSSLAVRAPAHPVAQAVLGAFGGPVAAPSANRSGRISPTTAEHVQAGLWGRIEAIVDGGACGVGVESTIVDLTGATPMLLRPGGLPSEAIEAALGQPLARHQSGGTLTAPGQMESHYAPAAPVRLDADAARPGEVMLGFGRVECDLNLSPAGDLTEAAANLFAHLHSLDATGRPIAVTPIPETGLGRAINDRLRRAAAPRG